jgi:hypothetical protein
VPLEDKAEEARLKAGDKGATVADGVA